MKKNLIMIMIAALTVCSCGTYTGSGAYAGASIGGLLGSAIGGITGGHRGSDLGTIVGMAGGAAVGAVMGAAADQERHDQQAAYAQGRYDERRAQRRTWRSGSKRNSNSAYIRRNSEYLKAQRGDDVYYNGGNNGSNYNRVQYTPSNNANLNQQKSTNDYQNDGGYDDTNSGDDRIEMK